MMTPFYSAPDVYSVNVSVNVCVSVIKTLSVCLSVRLSMQKCGSLCCSFLFLVVIDAGLSHDIVSARQMCSS